MTNVRPGWYPDGTGVDRWWDGEQWTDDTRDALPVHAPAYPPPYGGAASTVKQEESASDTAARAGWVLAILVAPLGFLIGLFLVGKHKDAVGIMVTAVVVTAGLYLLIG